MRRTWLLGALFLAAFALRPQLVGVGPLLPAIQHDLGVSHAVAGLLGTIPVLCMGLFAPPAALLSARIGSRRALAAALVLIGAFGVARLLVPGAAGVVLLTLPLGVGMGLAGALLPVAVKERFADRPAFATGVYTTGIAGGSAAAAAVAVPAADALGGWRTPLAGFAALAIALAVLWLWLTRRDRERTRPAVAPPRLPLRSSFAWRLVATFSLMGAIFYGLNSWLPDAYVEHGWSQSSAGSLLAVLNAVTIPCGFAASWAADRFASRRLWLSGSAVLQLAALLGLVLAPAAGWAWAVLLGVAIGPLFPLTLTLPLDAAEQPRQVAALAGMMLGFGYSLSALSPLVLGLVRDLSGGFASVLWLLVAAGAALVLAAASFSPARLAAEREPAVTAA